MAEVSDAPEVAGNDIIKDSTRSEKNQDNESGVSVPKENKPPKKNKDLPRKTSKVSLSSSSKGSVASDEGRIPGKVSQTPNKNRLLQKKSSRSLMDIRESGVLGSKNIFKKTAKYALMQSKADEQSEEEEEEEKVSEPIKEVQKAAETADKILNGLYEPGPDTTQTVNKAWKVALNKLEIILPAITEKEADGKTGDEKMREILDNIKAEMQDEGVEDMHPSVKGLRQFGIGKSGIARVVVNFIDYPPRHPLTACFQFPHTILNHKYVKHMVLSTIKDVPDSRIKMIQFHDRNVFHGTRAMDNRWIIRVSPKAAYEALLTCGIEVCNRRITMRPYDAVLAEEYAEYAEYIELQKKYMYDKIKNLSATVPKKALNILKEVTAEILPDANKSLTERINEEVEEEEEEEKEEELESNRMCRYQRAANRRQSVAII